MPDKYKNFAELCKSETPDSYQIEKRENGSAVALIAPHGGKIEPGTSEICRHVAGDDLTYYLFEGRKSCDNSHLHLTSSNFDEPIGLATAMSAQLVVTFHGQSGEELFINVGGLEKKLGQTIIDQLISAGYHANRQTNQALQGLDTNNICNRGQINRGVQLEISRGLRDRLVSNKEELVRFSSSIRNSLHQHRLCSIDKH